MSWQALNWVSSEVRGLTPSQRMVLLTMANYARPDGTGVRCGQKRLAAEVELSARQIIRIMGWLEDRGLITRREAETSDWKAMGLRSPRHVYVSWDLAMAPSATLAMQRRLPPVDDGANGAAGTADGYHRSSEWGDTMSPHDELQQCETEDALERDPMVEAEKREPATPNDPRSGRGDNLTPHAELAIGDNRAVDTSDQPSEAGWGDTSGDDEVTSDVTHNKQEIKQENNHQVTGPPATSNGGTDGPLVVDKPIGACASPPSDAPGRDPGPYRGINHVDAAARLASALVESLPIRLRQELLLSVIVRECEGLTTGNWTAQTISTAVRKRSWDGAGGGVVVRWIRQLSDAQVPPDKDKAIALRSVSVSSEHLQAEFEAARKMRSAPDSPARIAARQLSAAIAERVRARKTSEMRSES